MLLATIHVVAANVLEEVDRGTTFLTAFAVMTNFKITWSEILQSGYCSMFTRNSQLGNLINSQNCVFESYHLN